MNPAILTQVSEMVKNINVVFDGKLNSETAVLMTDKITQYLIFVQIKDFASTVVWAVAITISSWLIGKAIIKLTKDN